MRLIKQNFKKGFVIVKIENLDDLWYLSEIIEPGDEIKARTFRKIKTGKDDERSTKQVKKPVVIKIKVEKVEFGSFSTSLRVSGTILEACEEIPKGAHHTISIEEGTVVTIRKEQWLDYQKNRLYAAQESKGQPILLLLHNREEGVFAILKDRGFEVLAEVSGNVEKKIDNQGKYQNFYEELAKMLNDYDAKYNPSAIVIASPAFWKEQLLAEPSLALIKKKINTASCSEVSRQGLHEVLLKARVVESPKREESCTGKPVN